MFRLKMINKPKLFKLKFNFIFPQIVLANMQEKEITPTKETQIVEPDKNYDGLKKVTVNKIPDEYIIPTGEIQINQNGIYNVKDKVTANVNIPEKQLGTKTITSNGIYNATDDNLDGYSSVDVQTSGVDINDYFIKTPTAKNIVSWIKKTPVIDFSNLKKDAFYQLFENAYNLEEVEIINAEQVSGSANYMFNNTTKLKSYIIDGNLKNCTSHNSLFSYSGIKEIKNINTSNSTNLGAFASYCSKLTDIEELDGSKSVAFNSFCYGSKKLTNFGGIKNMGMAYDTSKSANYSLYGLMLDSNTNLTYESLMNVIKNLYDIASKGVQPQKLQLGSINLAKLEATEEGRQAIVSAQNKGWNVL